VHESEREKKRGTKTTAGIPLRVLYQPGNWVPDLIRPLKNDTV
jgi:hypothetical protein